MHCKRLWLSWLTERFICMLYGVIIKCEIFITFKIIRSIFPFGFMHFWIHLQIDHHARDLSKFPTIKQLDPQRHLSQDSSCFYWLQGWYRTCTSTRQGSIAGTGPSSRALGLVETQQSLALVSGSMAKRMQKYLEIAPNNGFTNIWTNKIDYMIL